MLFCLVCVDLVVQVTDGIGEEYSIAVSGFNVIQYVDKLIQAEF